ncbi:hypothetical protein K490DRAFT_61851 [Saccharata proteae CBS 121410]|uniref:Integral membrane protein n=1 Tax=Saccharata proteae CBS 121410 TaxID=1314787 RepID=A0A9P4HZR4_9PEZI|nr:hypothetical protein K490DRAFT_61851 [Saccharata proteae CBS 121410]
MSSTHQRPQNLLPAVLLALTTLTTLLPTLASSQTVTLINYAALPSCASSCTDLTTAQAGCVPPAAAVTNQQTYTSCFCQSAFLTSLYQTGSTVCSAACPDAGDQTKIQQWYVGFCRDGTGGVSSSAAASSAAATGTSSAAAGTATGSTGAVTSDGNSGSSGNGEQGSWISTHYKWIIMLAIIFLAMALISLLGLHLKRRHRRLQDAKRANLAAPNAYIAPVPPPPPMQMRNNPPFSASNMSLPASILSAGRTRPTHTHAGPSTSTPSITHHHHRYAPTGTGSETIVWGPHQHMAASRGYEYADAPAPKSTASLMSVPSPGPAANKGKARDVINEVTEDADAPPDDHPAFREAAASPKAGFRAKLSKSAR